MDIIPLQILLILKMFTHYQIFKAQTAYITQLKENLTKSCHSGKYHPRSHQKVSVTENLYNLLGRVAPSEDSVLTPGLLFRLKYIVHSLVTHIFGKQQSQLKKIKKKLVRKKLHYFFLILNVFMEIYLNDIDVRNGLNGTF